MAELHPVNQDIHSYFHRVYGSDLSDTDISDYLDRITKLFSLLIEIDERNRRIQNESSDFRNTDYPR